MTGVDSVQSVERPVVLHPAAHDSVDLSCDLGEVKPDLAVQPPSADLTADPIRHER